MPPTAQDVYNEIIRALSPTERLRLATLILNELVQQNSPMTIDRHRSAAAKRLELSPITSVPSAPTQCWAAWQLA